MQLCCRSPTPTTTRTITRARTHTYKTAGFPDGDERTLKKSYVKPMGPQHFDGVPTLGTTPLTDPDAFSAAIVKSPEGILLDKSALGEVSRKRRRVSDGSAEFNLAVTSPEEAHASAARRPKYREAKLPTGSYHEVVLVNPFPGDLKSTRPWWPALVVPAAEVMRDMIGAKDYDPKSSSVVRFFEDNL